MTEERIEKKMQKKKERSKERGERDKDRGEEKQNQHFGENDGVERIDNCDSFSSNFVIKKVNFENKHSTSYENNKAYSASIKYSEIERLNFASNYFPNLYVVQGRN